jgi:preprotein translocase subunit SecY
MNVSFLNLLRVPEIRQKIMFTLGFLLIYRIGFQIPLPAVDYGAFKAAAQQMGGGGLKDFINIMTGAQLQQATLFSLGVMPYISASIIFSLLSKTMPALEKISKEGPSGQRKINQYTRLATIPICMVQAMFVVFGPLDQTINGVPMVMDFARGQLWYTLLVMIALTCGTLFIMWLGEQITEHGAGNGISIIIMAGIIARLWPTFEQMASASSSQGAAAWQALLLFILTWGVAVVAVVYMTKAQRRIPIRQAKQTRGRKVYGGQSHFLPIKVNSAGVMPIIFASALLMIPTMLGNLTQWAWLTQAFSRGTGFWYVAGFSALIFFFAFFWTSMMFQPNEMANNLKESGAFIPGIRPGKKTAEFLEHTMVRVTLAGSAFLAVIAVMPAFTQGGFANLSMNLIYFMSGTSILIVVGVALDLVEKLNAMLIMRNYEGFMKESGGTRAAAAAGGGGWGRRSR